MFGHDDFSAISGLLLGNGVQFMNRTSAVPTHHRVGRGLQGKGRGSDKGPITGAMRVSRRSGSHPLRLVSIRYVKTPDCHGNFPEFLGSAGNGKARMGRVRNYWIAGA
jgi:hypothetical protein